MSGALDSVSYEYNYKNTFEDIDENESIDVSDYDKALLVIHLKYGKDWVPNNVNVTVDGKTVFSGSYKLNDCKTLALDLQGKSYL